MHVTGLSGSVAMEITSGCLYYVPVSCLSGSCMYVCWHVHSLMHKYTWELAVLSILRHKLRLFSSQDKQTSCIHLLLHIPLEQMYHFRSVSQFISFSFHLQWEYFRAVLFIGLNGWILGASLFQNVFRSELWSVWSRPKREWISLNQS